MMKSCFVLLSLFMVISHSVCGTDRGKMTREQYIAEFRDDAIRDMQKTGVPASITMAQALLESNDGNSPLAQEANNHFGIKCADWMGPTYLHDDDKRDDCFRKYESALESYDDHSAFLKTRPRYAPLFELGHDDYKAWAKGLKKAGYATDPHYADRLIRIIEENRLFELDHPENASMTASSVPGITSEKETADVNEMIRPQVEESHPHRTNHVMVPAVEVIDAFKSRKVEQLNGINFVRARRGDSFQSIAREFELGYWQLPKYNETESSASLAEGQIVYLQPKKNTGAANDYVTKEGDTVYSVAQATGVKIKYIYKYNGLQEGASLEPGRTLQLRKKSS